jgi:hypothetical protein
LPLEELEHGIDNQLAAKTASPPIISEDDQLEVTDEPVKDSGSHDKKLRPAKLRFLQMIACSKIARASLEIARPKQSEDSQSHFKDAIIVLMHSHTYRSSHWSKHLSATFFVKGCWKRLLLALRESLERHLENAHKALRRNPFKFIVRKSFKSSKTSFEGNS